jgi:hypothetical protein
VDHFLLQAPTPPSAKAMSNALDLLRHIGALTWHDEALTPLGQLLATLPMEPQMGKVLIRIAPNDHNNNNNNNNTRKQMAKVIITIMIIMIIIVKIIGSMHREYSHLLTFHWSHTGNILTR